jgi:hypothetical protein
LPAIPSCLAADDVGGCTVGKTADVRKRGLCARHYERARAHGDAYAVHVNGRKPSGFAGLVPRTTKPAKSRFARLVQSLRKR